MSQGLAVSSHKKDLVIHGARVAFLEKTVGALHSHWSVFQSGRCAHQVYPASKPLSLPFPLPRGCPFPWPVYTDKHVTLQNPAQSSDPPGHLPWVLPPASYERVYLPPLALCIHTSAAWTTLYTLLPVSTVASLNGLKWGLTIFEPLQLRSSINHTLWHTVDSQLIFVNWNSLVPVDLPGNHSHDFIVSLP